LPAVLALSVVAVVHREQAHVEQCVRSVLAHAPDDVELVMVDGQVLMENRQIPGVDLEALRREAQATAEQFWDRVPEWDPLQRTAEEACPWSFPLAGPRLE
jgi:hypothetical protein